MPTPRSTKASRTPSANSTESYPAIAADEVAWITAADMIEVDRVMIEDLNIELLQMMENAGRNLARLVLDHSSPDLVAVVAGSGGNGGGGLVAARHLANAGIDVVVTTTRPDLGPVPAHQYEILRRMGMSMSDDIVDDADVTIDAVIGYSLHGAPRGRSAELIDDINLSDSVTISLDTPSGLDVTTGAVPGLVVQADATMTLALPKVGLAEASAVGDLYLADISVPRSVTEGFGSAAPDFRLGSILRIE